MNRDYIRQIQMIELREFTDNLLSRVEELRSELKEYGSVSLGREVLISTHVKNFFKDVDKIKETFADALDDFIKSLVWYKN